MSHPSINVYHSEFYPALVLLNWTVELYWLDKCLLYTVNDHDIVLLVPDSCWATARNGNSIIATTLVSALCFCGQFDSYLNFLILQDKHNMCIVRKYKIHLHSLSKRTEQLAKDSLFLPVSKARTNIFYIFRQCTYIDYIAYIFMRDRTGELKEKYTWHFTHPVIYT